MLHDADASREKKKNQLSGLVINSLCVISLLLWSDLRSCLDISAHSHSCISMSQILHMHATQD